MNDPEMHSNSAFDTFWNEEASYASMCEPSSINLALFAQPQGSMTIAGGGCF